MFLYLNFLVFALTLASSSQSDTYGQCSTPDRFIGSCMMLNNCPYIEELYHKTILSKTEEQFLAASECRNTPIEDEVIVCCESTPRRRDNNNTSTSATSSTELPEPGTCGMQKPVDRILGGEETEIDTYRWMALLIYTREKLQKFGCGGSLINNRYVLTAAHCINDLGRGNNKFRLTLVRLGEYDVRTEVDEHNDIVADRAIDVGIEKKIVHPGYKNRNPASYHDIALLRLEQYITFTDFIQPICIHRNDDLLNVDISKIQMFASGWGVTDNGTLSSVKLHVPLKGKSLAQCQVKYIPSRIILQNTQLCAGGESGIDTCNGDSGGPLVLFDLNRNPMHYHIVGIISFGPAPCGQLGFPGVYTKVHSYIEWITNNLEP